MPSIHDPINLSALALLPTLLLAAPTSASDYPPPPGLYRPLSGEVRDDYRSTDRQARPYPRDGTPLSGETAPAFAPPAGADYRPANTVERASTPNTIPATAGTGSRLPGYLPKVVPGYVPPDTPTPERPRATPPPSSYPTDVRRAPRAPAYSQANDRRFTPPGGTSSRFSPSAPPIRPADPVPDPPGEARRFTGRPPAPAPGYPSARRFRPPSPEGVLNRGFSSDGQAMEAESSAVLRPDPDIAIEPRFSEQGKTYDSRFRPARAAGTR